jgi:leucyl-tRNA---protein transferase
MFAQVHIPEKITAEELDRYLYDGWFRNGQRIFTTNFLNFNSQMYSAIWLRIKLNALKETKTFDKLSKLNSKFKITIQAASVTDEKEELFQRYRRGMSFSASQSLKALLYGDSTMDVFNTYEVLLHDGDVLIGVGYFDLGKTSAAGIISFYDLSYKKYSLGKYIILLKVEYCKRHDFIYFYPGYFAPNYPAFDYKLTIGKEALSYLQLHTQTWEPIAQYSITNNPYENMFERLTELVHQLKQVDVTCTLYHYSFFEANIIPNLVGLNLFDFPIFVSCFDEVEDVVNPLIVFDVTHNCYHLVACKSVWKIEEPADDEGFYSSHLLRMRKHICSSLTAEEMAQIIFNASQSDKIE